MRAPHVSSGGRYPALRTIAVLYLFGALLVAGLGIWRTVLVFTQGGDVLTNDLFGAPTSLAGKVMVAACWLAATFIGVIGMIGIAELMKLFIDIEHNTRTGAVYAASAHAATAAGDGDGRHVHEGPAIPFVGERKIFAGDETAEGALIRGH